MRLGGCENEAAVGQRSDGNSGKTAPVGQGKFGNDGDAELFSDEGEESGHLAYASFGPQRQAGAFVHAPQ